MLVQSSKNHEDKVCCVNVISDGEGYRRWATVENLKRMAKTKLYMDEHGLSYEQMAERKAELS